MTLRINVAHTHLPIQGGSTRAAWAQYVGYAELGFNPVLLVPASQWVANTRAMLSRHGAYHPDNVFVVPKDERSTPWGGLLGGCGDAPTVFILDTVDFMDGQAVNRVIGVIERTEREGHYKGYDGGLINIFAYH